MIISFLVFLLIYQCLVVILFGVGVTIGIVSFMVWHLSVPTLAVIYSMLGPVFAVASAAAFPVAVYYMFNSEEF